MINTQKKELIQHIVVKNLIESGLIETKQIGEVESLEKYAEKNVLPAFFTYFIKDSDSIAFGMNGLMIRSFVLMTALTLNEAPEEAEIHEITNGVFKIYSDGIQEVTGLTGEIGTVSNAIH